MIFLFRFPLGVPDVDLTTERTHIWDLGGLQHIAPPLPSPHWTQLQDLLLPTLMVASIDLEKQYFDVK